SRGCVVNTSIPSKHVYIPNRHPRLTREEFALRWRQHARMGEVLDLPEVTALRYCLSCNATDILPSANDEYDGVALLALRGLASIPAADRVLTGNEVAYAAELRTFARPVEEVTLYTASELLVAGEETQVVVF